MDLRPFNQMTYHPTSEKIVTMLSEITQNENRHMFRVMLTYYFGQLSAQMRAHIMGWQNSRIPINIYAINLSESGTGKGFTMNKMENDILYRFRDMFLQETFPAQAEQHIVELADMRYHRNPNLNPDEEQERMWNEYDSVGPLLWSFDDATPAAIKQLRHKLLLANAGALNLQVDEIGDNLIKVSDAFKTMLELYDTGRIKDKLVKNTSENGRYVPIEGSTPANALLFGVSSSLLDGGETERKFYSFLSSGYARRCIFAYSNEANKASGKTAEELVDQMFNQEHDTFAEEMAEHFEGLADIANMNMDIEIGRKECLYLMKYKLNCEERGREFKEHQATLKAEIDHRYFKVMKLAAAYAFIDYEARITIDHLENAIKLVEDSGNEFQKLMTPERGYMKLAKFLASCSTPVTLSDLDESLACFKGTKTAKMEMIDYAIAWGYQNNMVIKRSFIDSIEFLKGEALQETNLNELYLSVSDHVAYRYTPQCVSFEELEELGTNSDLHWSNHTFNDDHRSRANVIPGFNLITLDIDGTLPLSTAMMIMEGTSAMFYTTKRHTEDENRYRIVIPTSHILELDPEEYGIFMEAVMESFPFEVDESCKEPEKKWLCNEGEVYFTEGKLFDVLPFIPRTSQFDKRVERNKQYEDFDGLQRWIMQNTGDGNRNKQLFRYAMVMADAGLGYDEVEEAVIDLNNKLVDKLSETEIRTTIMKQVAKKTNYK